MIKLKKIGTKCLEVLGPDKKLIGTLTDGDLRTALLKKLDLKNNIKKLYNKNPKFLVRDKNLKENAKKIFSTYRIDILPVLNKKKVVDIISWSDIFIYHDKLKNKLNDISSVIIAGGKKKNGEFSTIYKPLPIGEKQC